MREGGCDDHILSDGRLHLSRSERVDVTITSSQTGGFTSELDPGFRTIG
jgi:hypothetical protein